jgi:hypothetical protein
MIMVYALDFGHIIIIIRLHLFIGEDYCFCRYSYYYYSLRQLFLAFRGDIIPQGTLG